MYDKLIPHGIYGCFGETSEITGAEHLAKERAASPEVGEKWYRIWKAYQDDVIEAHKTDDLSGFAADQGQHRGRPHHHRGEGPRQPREDRARVPLHRRASSRPRRPPRAGPLLHGHVLRGGRMRDADGGRRLRRPHLPDGQGNVIGNPIVPVIKITGNPKTVRTMSEHVDVDVSGRAAPRHDDPEAGDALIEMVVRTANGRLTARGVARSPRVRDDEALSERVILPSPFLSPPRSRGGPTGRGHGPSVAPAAHAATRRSPSPDRPTGEGRKPPCPSPPQRP